MPDQEPEDTGHLAARFRALRAVSTAAAKPPGVDEVRRTVHRRRTVRVSLGLALIAVLVPLGYRTTLSNHPGVLTTSPPTESAVPHWSASPDTVPSTTATGQPGAPASGAPRASHTPACADPRADGSQIRLQPAADWDTAVCAGKTFDVFWVTYRTVDGNLVKYRSGQYVLSHATPQVNYSAALPPELCGYRINVVVGGTIPSSLPSSVTSFGSSSSFWRSSGQTLLWFDTSPPCA
jgi:hypothetical protein